MDGEIIMQTAYYTARQYPSQNNRVVVETSDIVTDADSSNRPTLSLEGFHLADDKGSKLWRDRLGVFAAHHIVKPAVLEMGRPWTGDALSSVLLAFPRGYQLFQQTRKDKTIDRYLYGSKHVRQFRSPEDFALHLGWLMKGQPEGESGRPGCECSLCNPSVKQAHLRQTCPHLAQRRRATDTTASRGRGGHSRRVRSSVAASQSNTIPYKDYSKLGEASRASESAAAASHKQNA